MRAIILNLISLIFSSLLLGQSSLAGSISDIPVVTMPRQDNYQLMARMRSSDVSRSGPIDFAIAIDTDIKLSEQGAGESLDNGLERWRIRISSPGAHSLNIGFSQFYLPPSARFYMYDRLQKHVIGPISAFDNDDHGQWWSPIIPYDEIVLELLVSPEESESVKLSLHKVNHDFTALGAFISGSCNVDVMCGAADGYPLIDQYRDVINSVGMYTLNGIRQCSGVLINNVRQDCTPYFLTANHCEVNTANAPSVVVYWNYQHTFCRTPGSVQSGRPGDGLINQFSTGAKFLAAYAQTDFALLLLDDDPSPYDPFFAGWDAQNESWDTTFSIHHPSSEEKRISFDFDSPTYPADNFFVRVENWELGTTEGGSSGAPLFSTKKHVIGQLNGGDASCSNSSFDDFGALILSWSGGGTKQTSLMEWLDPDNTGTLILDGRACANILASAVTNNHSICIGGTPFYSSDILLRSGFEKGAVLSVKLAPPGINVVISQESIKRGERATVRIEVTTGFTLPTASVIIEARDEDDVSSELNLNYTIFRELPMIPVLVTPLDNNTRVGLNAELRWASTSSEFIIEVSTDSLFRTREFIFAQINMTARTINGLRPNVRYFWRVKALNSCGESQYSQPFSFTVGDISCKQYNPEDLPKLIGAEPVTLRSIIPVSDDGIITDVNILNLEGKHTWISDLIFSVINPQGTEVLLAVNPCDNHNNFFISFDDQSPLINLPCPLVTVERYRPLQPLSRFNNLSAKGDWTLKVVDDVSLDGGSFDNWILEICTFNDLNTTATINLSGDQVKRCGDQVEPFSITGVTNSAFLSTVTLQLVTDKGANIDAEILPNPVPPSTAFEVRTSTPIKISTSEGIHLIATAEEYLDTFNIPIVEIDQPDTPILLGPAKEEKDVNPMSVVFSWQASPNTLATQFTLSTDSNFTSVVYDTIITAVGLTSPIDLESKTTYYWRIRHIGGCGISAYVGSTFTTDMMTSVHTFIADEKTYLFPNPASLHISISQEINKQVKELIIYDIHGRVHVKTRQASATDKIDISHAPPGLYFYEIYLDNRKIIGKLVITSSR